MQVDEGAVRNAIHSVMLGRRALHIRTSRRSSAQTVALLLADLEQALLFRDLREQLDFRIDSVLLHDIYWASPTSLRPFVVTSFPAVHSSPRHYRSMFLDCIVRAKGEVSFYRLLSHLYAYLARHRGQARHYREVICDSLLSRWGSVRSLGVVLAAENLPAQDRAVARTILKVLTASGFRFNAIRALRVMILRRRRRLPSVIGREQWRRLLARVGQLAERDKDSDVRDLAHAVLLEARSIVGEY